MNPQFPQQQTGFPQNQFPQQPIGVPQNQFSQQPIGFPQNQFSQQPIGFSQNQFPQQPIGFPQNQFPQQPIGFSQNQLFQQQMGVTAQNPQAPNQQKTFVPPNVVGYFRLKLMKDDQKLIMVEIPLEIEIAPDYSSCYIPVKQFESFCKTESEQGADHNYSILPSIDLYINGDFHFNSKHPSSLFLFPTKPEPGKSSPMNVKPVIQIFPGK
jgi:hypothetical protein